LFVRYKEGIKVNDEELRQAIEAVKEQQPVTVNLEWYQGTIKLDDVKSFIRANINSASRSFVAVGYYLKYIRDKQLFSQDGYSSIWEFAQGEFGISKPQASKFMAINDKFSVNSNSPILLEQYKDFSSSKLQEMLYLTDNQLEQVTIGTTVAEIREIKNPEKTVSTSKQDCFIKNQINETGEDGLKCSGTGWAECKDCDKSKQEPEPKPSYLKCAAYDFNKFKRGCTGCVYDTKGDGCPYDRTDYFAEIKCQEEWTVHCEVLKEMCNSICEMSSYILEKNNYDWETIQGLSRGNQDFSFGFGDDNTGHRKYSAWYKAKQTNTRLKNLTEQISWYLKQARLIRISGILTAVIGRVRSRKWTISPEP
jgi:hypothetical protein